MTPPQVLELVERFERNLEAVRIEASDWQIDALVYELYGLVEEEFEIVEEVTQ